MSEDKEKQVEESANNASSEASAEGAAQEVTEGSAEAEERTELEALRQELDAQQSLADEYLDSWKRTAAAFENYRKRQQRDQKQRDETTKVALLTDLLSIMDDLERALAQMPEEAKESPWGSGIQLVHRKFLNVVERMGLTEIETTVGEPFDPYYHEAAFHEPSDAYPEDSVLDILRRGYRIGDRVLRATMVKVAKPPVADEGTDSGADTSGEAGSGGEAKPEA
jgi:molecular chaperone GrpE